MLIIYALSWLGISLAYQFGSYKVQDEEKKRMKESQKLSLIHISLGHSCFLGRRCQNDTIAITIVAP